MPQKVFKPSSYDMRIGAPQAAECSTEVGADQDDLPREPMKWTDKLLWLVTVAGGAYVLGGLAYKVVAHLFSLF